MEFQLSIESLEQWLKTQWNELFDEPVVIGSRQSRCYCPIARWLQREYIPGQVVRVVVDEDMIEIAGKLFTTPYWIRLFIQITDDSEGEIPRTVLTHEALQILQKVKAAIS